MDETNICLALKIMKQLSGEAMQLYANSTAAHQMTGTLLIYSKLVPFCLSLREKKDRKNVPCRASLISI
jgi:hypothetical protein